MRAKSLPLPLAPGVLPQQPQVQRGGQRPGLSQGLRRGRWDHELHPLHLLTPRALFPTPYLPTPAETLPFQSSAGQGARGVKVGQICPLRGVQGLPHCPWLLHLREPQSCLDHHEAPTVCRKMCQSRGKGSLNRPEPLL